MNDQRNFVQKFANEGGGDVFVEDVKLAERTSQSTVASTDYILMEDTDGAFHKILKSSFNEAVRGAFGDMLANLDKGTSISALAALGSTGNDLGSITPANLASVLGASNISFQYKGADMMYIRFKSEVQNLAYAGSKMNMCIGESNNNTPFVLFVLYDHNFGLRVCGHLSNSDPSTKIYSCGKDVIIRVAPWGRLSNKPILGNINSEILSELPEGSTDVTSDLY